jgi:uncharacterized protein (TIGR04255 family)
MLLAPHLGVMWEEFKKVGFSEVVEQPPVMPTIENLDHPNQETELHFKNVPNFARIWFIHEQQNHIIQIQRDRFTFNWRKTEPDQKYPGFTAIFERFAKFYSRFQEIVRSMEVGEVVPLQYELTYIDQLLRGDGWNTLNDVGEVYKLFIKSEPSSSFWSGAESVILRTSFPIEDLNGRLHLAVSHRVRVSDQKQTLQTDFTMRGFPQAGEDNVMITWFTSAHGYIRGKFTGLFTEDIQTRTWGRK